MSDLLGGYVGAKKRYADWLCSGKTTTDNRTAEEIVNDVMAKAGLTFEGGETQ